jgi:hypothetical protein
LADKLYRQEVQEAEEDYKRRAIQQKDQRKPIIGDGLNSHRRSVTIDPAVTYHSDHASLDITHSAIPQVLPRSDAQHRNDPVGPDEEGNKPLPSTPAGPAVADTTLPMPYWYESIAHAFYTLGLVVGNLISQFISSILIFILGFFHCAITGILLVIATIMDFVTTLMRIFFNLITCHFVASDWGWEWSHLTRAWQWGRKSTWVWDFIAKIRPAADEVTEEKVAKRRSLHEARKEEYKLEQDLKAQEKQGQGSTRPRSANRAGAMGRVYDHRSMDVDLEKGNGPTRAS